MKSFSLGFLMLVSASAFAGEVFEVKCTFFVRSESRVGGGFTLESSGQKDCSPQTITLQNIAEQGPVSLEKLCDTATGYDLNLSLTEEGRQVRVETKQTKKNFFGKTKTKVLHSVILPTHPGVHGSYGVSEVLNGNGISCTVKY